jgi:hypothetical protein
MPRNRGQRDVAVGSRWVALGATLAVVVGAGGVLTSSAASPGASALVPITPCRLADTRPAPDNVGTRSTPIGPGDTFIAQVRGTNGNCTIPLDATGVSMNITIIEPTAPSFLTAFPADRPRPLTANLNWIAGQDPTPNAVTVALSADGRIGLFNLAGTVHVTIDIVGYYEPTAGGATGPQGPPGPAGADADDPERVLWVADDGSGDFISVKAALDAIGTTLPAATSTAPYLIRVAPGTYEEPGGIDLESHVDIEGSGRLTTTITCVCAAIGTPLSSGASAVVRADGSGLQTELRELSVVNTGGSAGVLAANVVGIRTSGVAAGQLLIDDVEVVASGAPSSTGILMVASSAPTLTDVSASASGASVAYGIHIYQSAPVLDRVVARGSNGGLVTAGVRVENASAPVLRNIDATATGSGPNVGLMSTTSTPAMSDSTVSATGGLSSWGVYLSSGEVSLMNVTARGSGANDNYGVELDGGGTLKMAGGVAAATGPTGTTNAGIQQSGTSATAELDSVAVSAQGGATARGLHNSGGVSTISNTTLSATSATTNYGVLADAVSSFLTVRESIVRGAQNSIRRTNGTVRVVGSGLNGGAVSGSMTCLTSYDLLTLGMLSSTCTP